MTWSWPTHSNGLLSPLSGFQTSHVPKGRITPFTVWFSARTLRTSRTTCSLPAFNCLMKISSSMPVTTITRRANSEDSALSREKLKLKSRSITKERSIALATCLKILASLLPRLRRLMSLFSTTQSIQASPNRLENANQTYACVVTRKKAMDYRGILTWMDTCYRPATTTLSACGTSTPHQKNIALSMQKTSSPDTLPLLRTLPGICCTNLCLARSLTIRSSWFGTRALTTLRNHHTLSMLTPLKLIAWVSILIQVFTLDCSQLSFSLL